MSSTPALVSRNPPLVSHTPPLTEHAIINVLIKLKNDAKSESTIKFTGKALTFLSKHADLSNPEKDAVFWNFVGNPLYRMLEKSIEESCRHSEKYRKELFEKIDARINELRSDKELLKERKIDS